MNTEFITLLGDVQIPSPNKHFQRIPTEYIFYIITDGYMNLIENEICYPLEPGDLILLEPGKIQVLLPAIGQRTPTISQIRACLRLTNRRNKWMLFAF